MGEEASAAEIIQLDSSSPEAPSVPPDVVMIEDDAGGEPAGAGYAWLAAAPSQPESFRNDHGTYRGPKFGSNATEGGYYTYEGGHMMH